MANKTTSEKPVKIPIKYKDALDAFLHTPPLKKKPKKKSKR
jgi:hypothetical protein